MKFKCIAIALVLALALPAFAQKPAAEQITSGPVVEGVGDSWASVAWTTNTGGSTVLKYGTDPKNLDQTAQAGYSDNEKSGGQNHRVHLKNLKPGTTYYYMATSGQGEGTGTQASSPVGQFTTKGTATNSTSTGSQAGEKNATVKITDGPKIEGVGGNWAVIAWTTNEPSSSVVRYGTDANNLNQTGQSAYSDNENAKAQNHRVRLTGLKPNTTYFFVADSGQGEGTNTEGKSTVTQFKTKAQ